MSNQALILGKSTDKELYELINELNIVVQDFLNNFEGSQEEILQLKEIITQYTNITDELQTNLQETKEDVLEHTDAIKNILLNFERVVDLVSDQQINGAKTFTTLRVSTNPLDSNDVVNAAYLISTLSSKFATIIGDLNNLNTLSKDLIVNSINEVFRDLNTYKESVNVEKIIELIDAKLNPIILNIQTLTSTSETALEQSEQALESFNNLTVSVEKNTAEILSIKNKISDNVIWTRYPETPDRKSIILENQDTILGTKTDGQTLTLLTTTENDKVEVGSTQIEINLKGSATRPTYNDNKSLAFMTDLETKVDVDDVYNKSEIYNKNEIDNKLTGLNLNNFLTLNTEQVVSAKKTFSDIRVPEPREGDQAASSNYVNESINREISEIIGDLNTLKTTSKDLIVNAINEIFDEISQGNINEGVVNQLIDEKISPIITNIGSLELLKTNVKDTFVNAINEIFDMCMNVSGSDTKVGDLSTLKTTSRDLIVNAINELFDKINDISNEPGLTEGQVNQLINNNLTPINETIENINNNYISKNRDNEILGVNTFNHQIKVLEAPTESNQIIRKFDLDKEINTLRGLISNVLTFKGILNNISELEGLAEKNLGDCYFINENQSLYIFDGSIFVNTGTAVNLDNIVDLGSYQEITGTKKFAKLKSNAPLELDDVVTKEFHDSEVEKLNNTINSSEEKFNTLINEIKDSLSNMNYLGVKATLQEINDLQDMKVGNVWFCSENNNFYVFTDEWKVLGAGAQTNLVTTDSAQEITSIKTFKEIPEVEKDAVKPTDTTNLKTVRNEIEKKVGYLIPDSDWKSMYIKWFLDGDRYGGGCLSDVYFLTNKNTTGANILTDGNENNMFIPLICTPSAHNGKTGLAHPGIVVLVPFSTIKANALPSADLRLSVMVNQSCEQFNKIAKEFNDIYPYSASLNISKDDVKNFLAGKGIENYIIIVASASTVYAANNTRFMGHGAFWRISQTSICGSGSNTVFTMDVEKVGKIDQPIVDITYSPYIWYNTADYNTVSRIDEMWYTKNDDSRVDIVSQDAPKNIKTGVKSFQRLGENDSVFKLPLFAVNNPIKNMANTPSVVVDSVEPYDNSHPLGTLWIKTSFLSDPNDMANITVKPDIYIKISETKWYSLHREEII